MEAIIFDEPQVESNSIAWQSQVNKAIRPYLNNLKYCSICNKLNIIYAKGLCKTCYNKIHLNKEKQKIYFKRWKDKNKEYFKEYYLLNKQIKIENESELN